MTRRLTARGRLTLVYTGLVLASGFLLTAVTYLLLFRNVRLHIGEAMAKLLTQAVPALLVVTALAGLTGWLVAGRILRPIRTIAGTATRLSAENLSERIPVRRPADELATLATTINGMLDRIQHGIAERDRVLDSQRLFVANAAHELRTPLTTIRTALDVTLDDTLGGEPDRAELVAMAGDIATAVETSQRTLDGLLVLARSQAGPPRWTPVDLAEVAAATVADAAGQAADGAVTLRADLRPAPASGEPVLLARMAGNLLENALRYNHSGGHVTVSAGTVHGHAFLRVVNTGRRSARRRNGGRSSRSSGAPAPAPAAPGSACPSCGRSSGGNPGRVVDTSTSVNYGHLYVAAVTDDGGLFWTIRRHDGSWEPTSNVKADAGDPGRIVDVSIADIQNTTHFLVRTEKGGVFHAIQYETGAWSRFSDVTAMTAAPGSRPTSRPC